MWSTSLLPKAFSRAFEPPPPEPIWKWAESHVWLENKAAAESGPYRSAKTPWTKRMQELIRDPFEPVWSYSEAKWIVVKVTEINELKSSQSGFSEGCLNGVRWKARYRPCNTIYAIDTREEAKNISERLLPTLERLEGANIFTGDDDDVGTYTMRLRAMDIWFLGSFSSGKFANKQAPLVIADEVEEHGQQGGDTSTLKNLASRKKTAPNGLQIALSKPKLTNGPIDKAHKRGNQEEFFVPCPHCGEMQWLTFRPEERDVPYGKERIVVQDEQTGREFSVWTPLPLGETRKIKTGRIVFEHCKDLLGAWDRVRILRDTYYECGECKGRIDEDRKEWMLDRAEWRATAIGTPGIISQHINDLYSTDAASCWGQLVLEFLDAKREGRRALQGFMNHRLGLPWKEEASKTEDADIRLNIAGREGDTCPPYKRGALPFRPATLLLGSDIGLNYARGAVLAVHKNLEDAAVIDWFDELGPEVIAEHMMRLTFVCPETGKPIRIGYGFMDAKYRKTECYRACLSVAGRRLIPAAGLGGGAARSKQLYSYGQIPNYPKGFKLLTYNDREAKDEMYLERVKKKVRRLWFPVDVFSDPQFVAELCAEELLEDDNGVVTWNPHPGPNHYGDAVKDAITGLRYLTRQMRMEGTPVSGAGER